MTIAMACALAVVLQGAMPIGTIVRDNMSNVEEPRQTVARTQAEWTALWRAHAGDQPAPKVDFGTHLVAAVFLGSRSTAGYSVEIIRAAVDGRTMTLEWRERRPDRDSILAQVITSPAHLATIPKFGGEIVFKKVD